MTLVTIAFGKRAQSSDVNQIVGLLKGTAGFGDNVLLTQYNSASNYTLTVRNQETTNTRAFQVQNAAGSGQLFAVSKTGTAVQSSESATYAMTVQNTDTTNGRALRIRNAEGTTDLLTVRRVSGNDVIAIGTADGAQPSTSLTQVTLTNAASAYVMSDFVYTSSSAADIDVGTGRFVSFQTGTAYSAAGGDNRALEIHMVNLNGDGRSLFTGADVSIQTKVAGSDGKTKMAAMRVRNMGDIWTVSGAVRADVGILIGRDNKGFEYPLLIQDIAPGLADLFSVDKVGTVKAGHLYPLAASTYDLGDGSTNKWRAIYANFLVATSSGSAAGPTITFSQSTTAGFFRLGANDIGVTTASTQRMNWDASGNVVVGTAALATTATDGFLYIPSCAGTPTGAPTAYTGRIPIIWDSTNLKLYAYSGGAWKASAAFT